MSEPSNTTQGGYTRPAFVHQGNASFTEVNSLTTFTEGHEETEALQPIADVDFHKLLEPFDKNDYAGKIIQAIFDLDMEAPSRVQCQVVPLLLDDAKNSLIAQAQSGSGKTLSFLVSALMCLDKNVDKPQVICLSNTRELAMQTLECFEALNLYFNWKHHLSVKNPPQPKEGKNNGDKNAKIVFGTPASVNFDIKGNKIDVSAIKMIIIDEADELLLPQATQKRDLITLLNMFKDKAQLAFFSATFPPSIRENIKTFKPNFLEIVIKRVEQVSTIKHFYTRCPRDDKVQLICNMFDALSFKKAFIFVNSKKNAPLVQSALHNKGIKAEFFSSELSAEKRDETLSLFKTGETDVIVATNVLARGIDVPDTTLVVNFELPIIIIENHKQEGIQKKLRRTDIDMYVHRAGRTGRFGKKGACISIIESEHDYDLRRIEDIRKQTNLEIKEIVTSEFNKLESSQ